MPLYVYHCDDCDTTFETLRSMAAVDDPQTCSGCGSTDHVNRKLTTFVRIGGAGEFAVGTEEGGSSLPMLGGGGCGCGGACSCG